MSIRATVRITRSAKNAVVKLLADLGKACADYQNDAFRNLTCKTVQCDEIWSFCYAKQRNVPEESRGTGLRRRVDLGRLRCQIPSWGSPSWLVGERTLAVTYTSVDALKGRIPLTTDTFNLHLTVVDSLLRDRVD